MFLTCQKFPVVSADSLGNSTYERGRKDLLKVRTKLALYHKLCQDYLHDLDITSLHPAEMAQREFPDEQPRWEHDDENIQEFRRRLNEGDKTLPLAVVECDVDFK